MDSSHYATLPDATTVDDEEAAHPSTHPTSHLRPRLLAVVAIGALLLLLALSAFLAGGYYKLQSGHREQPQTAGVGPSSWVGRGVDQGVSDKSSGAERLGLAAGDGYSWTNDELAWQRTSFHFQPERNWMNDPNGPMLYKGWYHLFYQYNPVSALWGNITWGHAVSRDLINWFHLPAAMVNDHWYDANGVWSGSATLLPDGRVIMLYTGSVNESAQVQNLAYPVDPSDPLLLEWAKSDANPILVPPRGVPLKSFRDPSTAWFTESDSSWRVAIGVKDDEHTGKSLVYRTKDFVKYELVPGAMHAVPGTGMWECVDFYPVSTKGGAGLDTSADGPGVKHVLKASRDDDMHDYYAIGSYDAETDAWTPDDPEADVGVGLRGDYGKYYASKTFYDQEKKRRLIWAWIGETDSARTDLKKGWASVQSVPRAVRFDEKTGRNLLQWPVEEVESLRSRSKQFSDISIAAGSVVPLEVGKATQLDILAEFEVVNEEALDETLQEDVFYNCSTSGGSASRGALGPFGLLVLADVDRTEQTAVYFYIAKGSNGKLATFVCTDELRSSHANDIVKSVYGSTVPVLDGEKLSLRILVDHSVVETFAQGGRTCITSRVYPTKAIHDSAKLFLFNNATNAKVTAASVKVWEMSSAQFLPFSHLNHTVENNLV